MKKFNKLVITWVEINRAALEHNIKSFRHLIGKAPLFIAVVKSNAYGHGLAEVAKICDHSEDVDRLGVVNLKEALLLKLMNIKKPVQVVSFFENDLSEITEAIQKKVVFPVYNIEQAELLNTAAKRIGHRCVVHLKIDTGTSRVGVRVEELDDFCRRFKKLDHLETEGLLSHFSSSESDAKLTKKQFQILLAAELTLKKYGIDPPLKHIACTAASALYPFSRQDAVRVGLGLYGLYPANKIRNKIYLKPVLTWKTTVIQVKSVKKGDKISYGGTYTMRKNGKLAVLPVGYFDGFDRAWSNRALILINGQKCPVRGRICMNLTMVDVTAVRGCKPGMIATIIGKEGKESVSADDLAKLTPGTINYEIVTKINPLLPRIVV